MKSFLPLVALCAMLTSAMACSSSSSTSPDSGLNSQDAQAPVADSSPGATNDTGQSDTSDSGGPDSQISDDGGNPKDSGQDSSMDSGPITTGDASLDAKTDATSTDGSTDGSNFPHAIVDGGLLGPESEVILQYPATNKLPASPGNQVYGKTFCVDAAGNFTYTNAHQLVRIDTAHTIQLSIPFTQDIYEDIVCDAAGNIYASGGAAQTPNPTGSLTRKFNAADFSVAWTKTLGLTTYAGGRVFLDGSGNVVSVGFTSQLPQTPANGGYVVARYAPDGTELSVVQVKMPNTGAPANGILDGLLDSTGNVYVNIPGNMRKVDAANVFLYERTLNAIQLREATGRIFGVSNTEIVLKAGLIEMDPINGDYLKLTTPGTRQVVLDPVENVIWNGSFSPTAFKIVTSADAIYLGNSYRNTFQNGSSPRPASNTTVIGKYDLNGNQIWSKQYLRADVITTTDSVASMIVDADGNLAVATTSALFRISSADGSIL